VKVKEGAMAKKECIEFQKEIYEKARKMKKTAYGKKLSWGDSIEELFERMGFTVRKHRALLGDNRTDGESHGEYHIAVDGWYTYKIAVHSNVYGNNKSKLDDILSSEILPLKEEYQIIMRENTHNG